MVDMLKSSREDDQRRRDEAQFYTIQQQLDELRRQLRENLARQQWFEELYKQGEGKVAQIQTAQDRLVQDLAQALHARQIDESRMKGQIAELAQRVESPDKQLRDIRAQIHDLAESRKSDRDVDLAGQRQIEDLHRQIREINSHISQVTDTHRQLRDLIEDLEATINEVRKETLHVAELQRIEEQRLRRQGMELQGVFEALRQQFSEVSAKSQRVDEVRHQLTERITAIEERVAPIPNNEEAMRKDIERIETTINEHYLTQQERLETARVQLEVQVGEIRQMSDQRMERLMNRFGAVDERIRGVEQTLGEIPNRFEALERRDELIGSEADTIEEWLVMRQLAAMESVLEDVRQRRVDRAQTLKPSSAAAQQPKEDPTPGSVYNPSGLLKSVRDARPPSRDTVDE
ncbi:MAG TPA: hypothetical protein VGE45_06780 [Chloroflexia bacterium]|jgi:chromosome segregation ATPase